MKNKQARLIYFPTFQVVCVRLAEFLSSPFPYLLWSIVLQATIKTACGEMRWLTRNVKEPKRDGKWNFWCETTSLTFLQCQVIEAEKKTENNNLAIKSVIKMQGQPINFCFSLQNSAFDGLFRFFGKNVFLQFFPRRKSKRINIFEL